MQILTKFCHHTLRWHHILRSTWLLQTDNLEKIVY